jgi:hypothetical protein
MSIKAGFLGYAIVDGTTIRINDSSLNLHREPLFFDHIVGLRDNIPSGIFGDKGDSGELNRQKIIYRKSNIKIQGSISYPLIQDDPLFDLAKTGDSFNIRIVYGCNVGRSFSDCVVNTYNISVNAGDFASVTADIWAIEANDDDSWSKQTDETKIITWDNFTISEYDKISGFSLDINNNCSFIYTASSIGDGTPLKIRVGMQEVTGNFSIYNRAGDLSLSGEKTINISCDALSMNLKCLLRPSEMQASLGPVVSSIPFVGVDRALGE